jgi:hexosaminidase
MIIARFFSFLFLISLSFAQVPRPVNISSGDWRADSLTPILSVFGERDDGAFSSVVEAFRQALVKLGSDPIVKGGEENTLVFVKGDLPQGVSYQIETQNGSMTVTAESSEGAAQAASTLLQLTSIRKGRVHCRWLSVKDGPSQEFRCFMVDMGRNPHSPKLLKQVIDMMWLYKANYLHLHLTDDQLFSWPSKAFPKLYSERAGWTWEDFVALEDYSQARGVTIIPEFDMPGHSTLLRKHYPEVFGKTPTDLASRPESRKGVETLIKEVLSVFKATPYYHMGGDEAYGVPVEVQRDFINRINIFVKSQGKQLLVWEGPHLGKGDNKVSTDVVHMIWRNTEVPAQLALDEGYRVINASWDPLYIVDHYPRTMFTAVDVERCYNFDLKRWAHINHGFKTFKNPHYATTGKGILGFCMPWWEGREGNLLPLCLPRLAAVAAKAWNPTGETDFSSFQERQKKIIPIFEKISGYKMPELPVADPATQKDNLAYLAKVTPSAGATQPQFGPQRLTNGIPDKFDHFLGFPTQPTPLEIIIELKQPADLSRIVVFERAIGKSHEIYDLEVSVDGMTYEKVGASKEGTRGDLDHVEHRFQSQRVAFIKISTQGCHGLTFPSFSRLSEVQAFAE